MTEINRKIFKQYDIRGIYPGELDEKAAFLIGKVCARKFKSGVFIAGYDVRFSSKPLLSSFLKGFKEESKELRKNFSIKTTNLVTTPMFYFLVNRLKAVGGVMATASHNPSEYGGFKIVAKGAQMVSGKEIGELVDKL